MKLFLSLLLIAIPNSLFWLLSIIFSVDRPVFNLEYLLVSALLFLPKSWPSFILFIIFSVIDILTLLSQVFIFINLGHLIYLSKFIFLAPAHYQILTYLVILALLIAFFIMLKIKKYSSLGAILFLFNIGLLVYIFEMVFLEPEHERIYLIQHKLVGSPTIHNLYSRSELFFKLHSEKDNYLIPINNESVSQIWRANDTPAQMLLIINESWGVHRNADAQQEVIKPLTSLQTNGVIKIISHGKKSFNAATVNGELKELCLLSAKNFNLKILDTGFESCLPNKLLEKGYHTEALHTASGVLYDRIYWYPRAGFKATTFFENHRWQRRCYSYPGACDFEAINLIADTFTKHQKLFFYWLTLNTHANYDRRDIIYNEFDCKAFNIKPGSQTCRNLILQKQFFIVLATAIKNGAFSGAEIIIVSDHQPIISNLQEKTDNFEPNQIPWIRFSVY